MPGPLRSDTPYRAAPIRLLYRRVWIGISRYLLAYLLGIVLAVVPVLLGFASRLPFVRALRPWHALWVGLPIGFVGTLGVYYSAAASI